MMMNSFAIKEALLLVPLFLYHISADNNQVLMAPMEKTEREALYMVIQGFVGKGWNGSGLYPDPCGRTMIQGVSCDLYDGFWYITDINIGPMLDNSLECAPEAVFSPKIFELKHLKTLSLFNCFTSSYLQPTTIPSQNWSKLSTSLETIEIRSNQGLIGEIPTILGQLTNLKSLVLVDNALTGELPQELANLAHLQRLVLSGNQFIGSIPYSFGSSLDELLILDLSRNSLTGSLPASLGDLTSLIKLDLSHNFFNGSIPSELAKLASLTLLDLNNNMLFGGLTKSLENLVSLQDLVLSNNPLGGDIMSFWWENLRNLTTLDLSNDGFNGEIPEAIAGLTKLRFLALNNNKFTGSVPSKLGDLPWINAMYLNGNNLTGVLGFSGGFYEKMGRRFASWNNPMLCYSVEGLVSEHGPYGVQQCKHGEEVGSDGKGKDGIQDKASSSIGGSLEYSSCLVRGFFWTIFLQEVVVLVVAFYL